MGLNVMSFITRVGVVWKLAMLRACRLLALAVVKWWPDSSEDEFVSDEWMLGELRKIHFSFLEKNCHNVVRIDSCSENFSVGR